MEFRGSEVAIVTGVGRAFELRGAREEVRLRSGHVAIRNSGHDIGLPYVP